MVSTRGRPWNRGMGKVMDMLKRPAKNKAYKCWYGESVMVCGVSEPTVAVYRSCNVRNVLVQHMVGLNHMAKCTDVSFRLTLLHIRKYALQ
jgi:hypothetical protein